MSEGAPDIARIVNLIMENPKLIEEISGMVKKESEEKVEDALPEASVSTAEESAPTSTQIKERSTHGRNRSQLLGALKPYVSRERAQAIDSMLSIVEILDAMTGR